MRSSKQEPLTKQNFVWNIFSYFSRYFLCKFDIFTTIYYYFSYSRNIRKSSMNGNLYFYRMKFSTNAMTLGGNFCTPIIIFWNFFQNLKTKETDNAEQKFVLSIIFYDKYSTLSIFLQIIFTVFLQLSAFKFMSQVRSLLVTFE